MLVPPFVSTDVNQQLLLTLTSISGTLCTRHSVRKNNGFYHTVYLFRFLDGRNE